MSFSMLGHAMLRDEASQRSLVTSSFVRSPLSYIMLHHTFRVHHTNLELTFNALTLL